MKLTVIGCSGSYPGPDSAASCYLLEAPYEGDIYRLLIDLGSGSLGPLQNYVALEQVNAIALSHLHADHCLDLCGFYVVRKYHPGGHLGSIPVYGPSGTAELIARAYDLEPDPGMRFEFDFHVYDGALVRLGPFVLQTTPVAHPVESYALAISDGQHRIVYSGDTGP
ncbi:MAG: MBL fold metallo-hydrolase, partial [Nocardioidaceae bacterium]